MTRSRTAATLALSLLALAVPASAQTAAKDTQAMWRTARNCGLNCLYLMARAHGIPTGYDRVAQATPVGPKGTSLPELRAAAIALDLPARIGKGGPAELARARLPVLAHLDTATGDVSASGHYVLVTAVDTKAGTVGVFDGASAMQSAMPIERFRRSWSGYLLYFDSGGQQRWLEIAVSLATLALAWLIFVRRRATARASLRARTA